MVSWDRSGIHFWLGLEMVEKWFPGTVPGFIFGLGLEMVEKWFPGTVPGLIFGLGLEMIGKWLPGTVLGFIFGLDLDPGGFCARFRRFRVGRHLVESTSRTTEPPTSVKKSRT